MKAAKQDELTRGRVMLAIAALVLVLLPFAHMIRRDAGVTKNRPAVVLDLGESRLQAMAVPGIR